MRHTFIGVLLALLFVTIGHAAEFEYDENFLVFAPNELNKEDGQVLAKDILNIANKYRQQIAKDWLGEEIPLGVGRASISVSFETGKESALTWAKDHQKRTLHKVYIRATAGRAHEAVEDMLGHEIVHVVLATQYPHPKRLPPWLEEGIASRYDDAERKTNRQGTVIWWRKTGNWCQLTSLLDDTRMGADQAENYAAAASLVDYLLTQGDKATLFRFARDGQTVGWNDALQEHYRIKNTEQLQNLWQTSVEAEIPIAVRTDAEQVVSLR